jgi:hypothetical protein
LRACAVASMGAKAAVASIDADIVASIVDAKGRTKDD